LATSIGIYQMPKLRSQIVTKAMFEGAIRMGYDARIVPMQEYDGPRYDMLCQYGFDQGMEQIFADYRAAGKPAIYIDLGYFLRRYPSRFYGYHKIILNGRHPVGYHRKVYHPQDRADRLGIQIAPWKREGKHIVLCGMSGRASAVAGYEPQGWETYAVGVLRKYTDRPIVYRPKPSWKEAKPIPGTIWGDSGVPLFAALEGAHALVTYNSNAALEALMWGYPVFTVEGVAKDLASGPLYCIEAPLRDGNRQQLLNDIAYVQWNVAEMTSGAPLAHMKSEGLIP
jgi:hypothetical protein